ncbi:MAG TPA: CoA pyrophosphatase [Flavobacteriales bacterium]|nr:CoA pyrophosphatase [Flavobacteriales bacterium]HQW42103.1 CoA pyrophosphatase [Flavobacteriales bacterium]
MLGASAILDILRTALSGPLPGHEELLALSGYSRLDIERARALDPAPRESAVLALLYPKGGQLHCLLMVRPIYDGVHSGQVAFPGGKREPGDPSLKETALREFHEETGADPKEVEVLGALTPVYIPPSRMVVTPFVGFVEQIGPWQPDPMEVARLIEAPLEELLREDVLKKRDQYIEIMGRTVEIPYFEIHGEVVWGATALMLGELRVLLR